MDKTMSTLHTNASIDTFQRKEVYKLITTRSIAINKSLTKQMPQALQHQYLTGDVILISSSPLDCCLPNT